MQTALNILKQYWQFDHFLPLQENIIQSVVSGKDTLALLPTGGGKSVCYQIPALMQPGICLVITPLISLMKNQAEALEQKGIAALYLHSHMHHKQVHTTLQKALQEEAKFLFIAPERLASPVFQQYLFECSINLIAIDEAHCISQWGYQFRPSYLQLGVLKEWKLQAPLLALTASATPAVQLDIIQQLHMHQPAVFKASFERNNLSFQVQQTHHPYQTTAQLLQKNKAGSSLVYCKSRRIAKEVALYLQQQGLAADFYHAGLPAEERHKKQALWMNNQIKVLAATNAFGMGIDKPNVRTVVHVNAPYCLESYYQEAGRAGRDGNHAEAVLLYQPAELDDMKRLPELHFPSVATLRLLYQQLGDFLGIAAGCGAKTYYNFDLTSFVNTFHLQTTQVINGLKLLQAQGYLSFHESIFLPSAIGFTTDKNWLFEFQKQAPQYEPLIKCLLRTYEGIFNYTVPVYETQIARLLNVSEAYVRSACSALAAQRIIEYQPAKELPQIYFMHNRTAAADLHWNHESYKQQKKYFTHRLQAMLQYITETHACRSQMIAHYFGADMPTPCNNCDNCIRKKQNRLSKDEFEQFKRELGQRIGKEGLPLKELEQCFPSLSKETLNMLLNNMQREEEIYVNSYGRLFMNI